MHIGRWETDETPPAPGILLDDDVFFGDKKKGIVPLRGDE
jgi:hypothetical protein